MKISFISCDKVRCQYLITPLISWVSPMEICHVQNVHKSLSVDKLGFVDLNPYNIKHNFTN